MKVISKEAAPTLLEEAKDTWASRETSASLDFFAHLRFWAWV
jgi:hypothetical protein